MDNFEERSYHGKGKGIKELCEGEIGPCLDVLQRLSGIAHNFACTAAQVSNVNATEGHEIEELLDLVFDIRKVAEKLFDACEDNIEGLAKEIKDCK